MNKLIIVLILSLVLVAGCQAQNNDENPNVDTENAAGNAETQNQTEYEPGSWITDYPLALSYAEKLDRPVLINFTGSDWCPWCFRLRDEVFVQPEFADYAKDNLILLTIDFPSKKKLPAEEIKANQALAEKYDIEGYPTILLLDAHEMEIARTGYQPGGAQSYVKHLQDLISEAKTSD